MPSRARTAMYNTPTVRTGGFGAIQVEALTNRPLSIARRHLAASQLRMRDIEPDELNSSEWIRFLAMPEMERDRWMNQYLRRRRNSAESSSSREDRETQSAKAEEARLEAAEARRAETGSSSAGATPAVSLWVRQFDDRSPAPRPVHERRAVETDLEAPPTYASITRSRTPPPAYAPRTEDEAAHDLTRPAPFA